MAKPIRALELHYPMIQFLIMINMYLMNSRTSKICLNMKYLPKDYSIIISTCFFTLFKFSLVLAN